MTQTAETARDYVMHAGGHLREGYSQVAERPGEGSRKAGDVVRHNPGRAVAAAFGADLIVGVLDGLVLSVRLRR